MCRLLENIPFFMKEFLNKFFVNYHSTQRYFELLKYRITRPTPFSRDLLITLGSLCNYTSDYNEDVSLKYVHIICDIKELF